MAGPATSELVLSRIGGIDPVRLPVFDLAASWQINGGGTLSAFATREDVLRRGLMTSGGDQVMGYWVSWRHPTAGNWGGRVVATRWNLDDRTVELACESWASALLRKRRTPRMAKEASAPPGGHVAGALRAGLAEGTLWLTGIRIGEDGAPVPYQWRGADLYDDLLPAMVDLGFEWTVTEERVFVGGPRVGTDRSQTVRLVHPYHVTGGRWTTDLWSATNDILGLAADDEAAEAFAVVVEDADSIVEIGRLQETREYEGVAHAATQRAVARADLARSKDPFGTLEDLTVVDADRCWSWFREGDTIRVDLGVANASLAVRILARAVDLSDGVMAIAGEVEERLS